jgi:hypothetical protein
MKITKELLREMVLKEMATFAGAKDKIEQGMTFAVFSSYRGERSSRENRAVDQKVREYLNSTGYPYTIVEGGFKETPRDPETNEPTGEETTSEIEKSYLIFEQDSRPDVQKSGESLFDVANKACEISDQEAFSYGYPRKVVEPDGTEKKEMFIAIYKTGAPAPGDQHRIQAGWAGPWSSYDEMKHDTGYYTKIRGGKGTFMEEITSLQEQVKSTNSTLKKRELRYKIHCLRELQGEN